MFKVLFTVGLILSTLPTAAHAGWFGPDKREICAQWDAQPIDYVNVEANAIAVFNQLGIKSVKPDEFPGSDRAYNRYTFFYRDAIGKYCKYYLN